MVDRFHFTLLGLALVACLVFGVTSAQAANLVTNPGFEDGGACAPSVCNWSAGLGTTIARDTLNPHSGSADVTVRSNGTTMHVQAASACFAISPSTAYNVGGWYRTSTDFATVEIFFYVFAGANCTGATSHPPGGAGTSSPVTSNTWTFIKGSEISLGNSVSASVRLLFSCTVNCANGNDVNFDDVAVQTQPLAVTVASIAARPVRKGVLLRWRTESEVNLLGFGVYRAHGHSWRRISHLLIPARGTVSGASYRFLDRTARRGVAYRYRIKAVNRDGTSQWFGPVRTT